MQVINISPIRYIYIYSFVVTLLMKLVLILNNFVFNGVNYLQKKGTAMGTRAAPNFANVFMGYYENRFVYQSRCFKRFIKSWWRYIDDTFMLSILSELIVPYVSLQHSFKGIKVARLQKLRNLTFKVARYQSWEGCKG